MILALDWRLEWVATHSMKYTENEKQRQDSKVGRPLCPWSIQTKGLSGSRLAFVSKGIKKQRIVSGDEQDNSNFNL